MTTRKVSAFASIIFLLFCLGCQSEISSEDKVYSTEETTLNESKDIAGSKNNKAGEDKLNDRKLMRQADLRCRVTNVYDVVAKLEQQTKQLGGLVMESNLTNNIDGKHSLPSHQDSVQEIQTYNTEAWLELRLPVATLDTFLLEAIAQASFVDSRNTKQTDATLAYLSNQLKNEGARKTTIRAKAKDVNDATIGEAFNEESKNNQIDRKIENMAILDNVEYATLTISLYQPREVDAIMVANTDKVLRPSFGYRIGAAFAGGWDLITSLFIGLLYIWPLWLIGTIAMLLFMRFKGRKLVLGK